MSNYSFTDQTDKLEFVRSQCRTIAGAKHHKNYTMIRCPFHNDLNPSGSIFHFPTSRSPGFFKCYGCGKTATWNELAPLIGCEPFSHEPRVRYINQQDLKIDEDLLAEKPEKLVFSELPSNKLWRGIKTNLLKKIGSKICQVKYGSNLSDRFIYLPVIIDGHTVGYTKGRMHKVEGQPSYINLKGSWVKSHGLFPFDFALSLMTDTKTVVLVEGQRDALRLLSLGIPAMCVMGTQNFSDNKARLLAMHGVERCIIFMDGDTAGISGTNLIYSILSKFVTCKVIKLWAMKSSPYLRYQAEENPTSAARKDGVEFWDPGNCPSWILEKINRRYIHVNHD